MKHLLYFLAFVLVFMSCGRDDKPLLNERYTLRAEDDNPFGGSVFFNVLSQQYPYEAETYNLPFSKWYKEKYRDDDDDASMGITYLIAAPRLLAWEDDAEAMQKFVVDGNTLVLASDYFSSDLQNKLRFKHDELNYMSISRMPFEPYQTGTQYVNVPFDDSIMLHRFQYYYTGFLNKIYPGASIHHADTIGFNEQMKPDIIRYRIGDGELILVTNTRALSNYFLLAGNNIRYAQLLISYLPETVDYLVYDKFYSGNPYRQPKNSSVFSAFLKHEALRWAFWLTIISSMVWLLLGLRRKQRIIPVVATNKNETVAFAETISNLYFNRHDNKNIALKMIAQMHDALRQRYYISVSPVDAQYVETISSKTGISREKAQQLAKQIEHVQAVINLSDDELMQLHFNIRQTLN